MKIRIRSCGAVSYTHLFPADEEGMKRRYLFISEMFAKMGLPVYDGEIGEMLEKLPYFKEENQ